MIHTATNSLYAGETAYSLTLLFHVAGYFYVFGATLAKFPVRIQFFVSVMPEHHKLTVCSSQRRKSGETYQWQRQQSHQDNLHIRHSDLLTKRLHLLSRKYAHHTASAFLHVFNGLSDDISTYPYICIQKEEIVALSFL